MAIEASRFKKDVTREYNTCEKKRKILDKAVCMTVLRSRLENDLEYNSKRGYYYRNSYGSSGLIIRTSREFEEYSNKELRQIHQRDRKIVQEYIARLDR